MPFYNQVHDSSTFHFWVGGKPKEAFSVFANAYRRAAERLTNALLRRNSLLRGRASYEACAVVFLYRHALELSLKHAIYKAAECACYSDISQVDNKLQNHHNLQKLAEILRRSLSLLFPDDSSLQELLTRLTTTTQELAEIEPTSYVFRYPIDTKGRPASEATVNLRAFAQHMSTILEDIETLNFGLNAQTDIASDAFDAFTEESGNVLAEYP
jgi:hypothetical protein